MPDEVDELKQGARAAEEKQDFAAAADLYEQLASIDPDPAWHARAGELFVKLGEKRAGLLRLSLAAEAYAAQGELLKAIALCKGILELDPQHRATQARLASLYARRAATGPKPPPPPPRRTPAAVRAVSPSEVPVPAHELLREMDVDAVAMIEEDDGTPVLAGDAPLEEISLREVLSADTSGEFAAAEIALEDDDIQLMPDESLQPLPPRPPGFARAQLPQIPLFSSLDADLLRRLIERVDHMSARAGEVIVRQGDSGTSLYIIVSGTVEVSVEAEGKRKVVNELGEGLFFGELALMTNSPRTATVTAKSDVELLVISRAVVGELIEQSLDVLRVLLRFFRDRLIGRLVQTSPLFSQLHADEAQALAARFQFLEYEPGATIIAEGEHARGLFVILSGTCDAIMSRGGLEAELGGGPTVGEVKLTEFGPGSVLGEISLLQGLPSLVTVRAHTRTWMLAMPEQVFRQVLGKHPQMIPYLRDLASRRLKEMAAQNLAARVDDDEIV